MQSYRSILTGLHAIVAVLFGLAAAQHERFLSFSPDYGRYLFIGALLGLFFMFRYANVVSDLLIEKIPGFSPWLRRTISGHDCIEGDWPLVVLRVDPKMQSPPALIYLGFLTITYKGGELKISGDDWTPDGTYVMPFESQQSRLASNVLQYWYYQGAGDKLRGYTEIYFFPKDGEFERHAGEFVDKDHNAARFYARRLTYGRGKPKRPRTGKERLAAAQAFWDSIKDDIGTITKRPHSADWE